MPKDTRGATRSAAGKKKAKKRPESAPIAQIPPSAEAKQSAQSDTNASGKSTTTVIQFRPRSRDAGPARTSGKASGSGKAYLQTVDYSYVFTDLRIIGVLAFVLIAGLIALSFVVR